MIADTRRLVTGLLAAALPFVLATCGDDPAAPEAVDPCAPAAVTLGSSVNGSIDVDSCQRGGFPVDRWAFDLSRETDIRIDLTSSVMDPYLELQTTSGSVIAANDDFNSLNSAIITRLSAGSYIIQARDLGGRTGSYRLSLQEGPDCSPVGELELGRTEAGSLESDDCVWEAGGLSDNWTLTLAEQMNLRIEAKSPDFDEVVLIRDHQGNIVNGADESGPTGFAQLDMPVPAGAWTITVGALTPGRSGGYELNVDLTPPCTPGTELVLGQTETGSISASDCRFEGYVPADSFALVLDHETPLDFHLKSADMQPFLIVRDANGHDVVFADDVSFTGSARAQATLEAGTYAVYALTFSYPQIGTYQLTVSEIVCPEPTPIAFGTSETGTLGDDDCLGVNGAWYEPWSLELAADATVRIDMVSDDIDPYLILKDGLGNVLTADDDGGDGFNARIETTLAAGSYEIGASAFGPGQVGVYTLTVDAPPEPAATTTSAVATPESGPGAGRKDAALTTRGDWQNRAAELRLRLVPEWVGVRKPRLR